MFVENKKEGQGVFLYPNGELYSGQFMDNNINGEGKMILDED